MATKAEVISIQCRSGACEECVLNQECVATGDGAKDPEFPVPARVMRHGAHLFRNGDEFDSLYVLRSGSIKTYVTTEAGDEQVIGFHMPGEVLGLDGIDSGLYRCSAVALDTCSVCTLPFERLCRLCASSAVAFRRLLERFSHKSRHDERMLLTLGQKSADQRIASFLLNQSRRQKRHGISPNEINLPMSRADIASYLALAGETLSRVVTRLQTAGLVVAERHRIHILDYDALAAIADGSLEEPLAVPRRGVA